MQCEDRDTLIPLYVINAEIWNGNKVSKIGVWSIETSYDSDKPLKSKCRFGKGYRVLWASEFRNLYVYAKWRREDVSEM
jgi:hypothetical protein